MRCGMAGKRSAGPGGAAATSAAVAFAEQTLAEGRPASGSIEGAGNSAVWMGCSVGCSQRQSGLPSDVSR